MFVHYKQGYTPNPDILCNREIKFDAFAHYAKALGGDIIATGHYAQLKQHPNHSQLALFEAIDTNKDQTYFLSHVHGSAFQNVTKIYAIFKHEYHNRDNFFCR